MARYLKRLAAATLAILGFGASAPAMAGGIQVTVATPKIVVAAPPVISVHRVRPAPDLVWVAGTWRRDARGHQIWVPGYWHNPRTGVIVHHQPAPAPVSRTVVIRR